MTVNLNTSESAKLTGQSVNSQNEESNSTPTPKSIGIALSGGGARAILFHLGVIRFLSEAKALNLTKQICSVSGGSVLSAHLLLNWEKYLQSDPKSTKQARDPFFEVTRELIRFVQYDVRGKILRRSLLYFLPRMIGVFNSHWRFSWSNTGRLQSFYEKLLY